MERKFSLGLWRSLTLENFNSDLARSKAYEVNRGLDYYLHFLPEFTIWGFFRKNFFDVIRETIKKKGRAAILDVGCGEGVALAQLKERFGASIETWGISATDSRTIQTARKIDHYLVGDIHSVSSPPDHFDVITASNSFRYFADPLLVLKRIYRLLKPGGFGFIDLVGDPVGLFIYWCGLRIPHRQFIELLGRLGYSFQQDMKNKDREYYNLAFRRDISKPRLVFPITYQGAVDWSAWDYFGIQRLSYCWVGNVPKDISSEIIKANEELLKLSVEKNFP